MSSYSLLRSARSFRPILFVANSSWYLVHYRCFLIEALQQDGEHVIALAPVDSSTPQLSRLLVHIPWRIHRSTDANPFFLAISFLRMLFLVRAIKPRLVHSHTLKANLLAAVVTAFFGIPCVLSFAGMGRLSKATGFSRLGFLMVLRAITFLSFRQRCSRWSWLLASRRSAFVFQNPNDQQLFQSSVPGQSLPPSFLILGSGVPLAYLQPRPEGSLIPWSSPASHPPRCEFLFCARLLRSKGIGIFLELSSLLPGHRFTVFGGLDPSSQDSLRPADLLAFERQYPNVTLAGTQRDPLLGLQAEHPVLVVPSQYGEGLPRAVVEALALGIPVLSSRSATCGVFPDSTVYVADGDATGDYLRCFERLLSDYAALRLPDRLQLSRQLVEQHLSESVVVEKTLAVYQSLENSLPDSYLLDKDNMHLHDWLAQ